MGQATDITSLPWFTVVGAYADTKESYLTQVQAEDAVAAKAAGYRQADGVVIGLTVFPGRINAARMDTTVTPLRPPDRTVVVDHVVVTRRQVSVPSRCPACRGDLTSLAGLLCTDLWLEHWTGHLSQDRDRITSERYQERAVATERVMADAVTVRCRSCGHVLHDVEDHRVR